MEARKRCARCRKDKPVSQFYSAVATFDDLRAECRACSAAKCRARRAANNLRQGFTPPSEKRCSKCGEVKPSSGFSSDAGSTDGLYGHCKKCGEWVHRCRRYGLPKERVLEMLQQKRCEACGDSLESDTDKHFDHRHADGAVRGILCDRCNTTIGKCRENKAILMALCNYLTRTAGVDYRKQPYLGTKEGVTGTLDPIDSPTPEADGTQCPTISPQKLSSPQV